MPFHRVRVATEFPTAPADSFLALAPALGARPRQLRAFVWGEIAVVGVAGLLAAGGWAVAVARRPVVDTLRDL